jgi:hypothetical protein
MRRGAYWYAIRPADTAHQHPFLVFDVRGQLDVPFTAIAKEAVAQFSLSTARTYLNGVLPYLTFLATDEWQVRAGRRWDAPPRRSSKPSTTTWCSGSAAGSATVTTIN